MTECYYQNNMPKTTTTLPKAITTLYSGKDRKLIDQAVTSAKKYHEGQKRASGDPYYHHPIAVAEILAEMKLDRDTIITAILHDTIEDTSATLDDIEKDFGPNIAQLVDGVTKLTQISFNSENTRQAENFRKFLTAISEDIRVLLVKLADRLHNMRTLHFLDKEKKRQRIAHETMEIYVPLAERIGAQKLKEELEELAFKELQPEGYTSIMTRLEQLRKNGTVVVERIIKDLQNTLEDVEIRAPVIGREKAPFSIWRKMQNKNIEFEQLTDIMAFRAVVDTVEECYLALGAIHSNYQMIPGSFKDFISTPKENGYRSLHTVIIGPNHQRIEIQIRTHAMHEVAEWGVAAHWIYKQGGEYSTDGKQYRWIRELLHIVEQSGSAEEFLEHTKLEMYHDQVFCFTPKGRLIVLPQQSTPVDFAFAVHSEVGRTCVGAKVNNRIVPLRTRLKNGDQVEIITSKSQNPSPVWEKFVVTGKARSEIRRFMRTQQRDEFVRLGKAILTKTFKQEQVELRDKDLKPILPTFGKQTTDDLYAAVGEGVINKNEIFKALYPDRPLSSSRKSLSLLARLRGKRPEEEGPKRLSIPIKGLIPDMAVHFAGCCHPLPGEPIVGIVNTGKGVTVHTANCDELERYTDEPERWVDLAWEDTTGDQTYVGRLKAVLEHKAGSLGVLSNSIAKDGGNINNLRITHRTPEFFELILDVEVSDVKHLANVMAGLRSKKAVHSVERYASGR